LTDNSDLPRRRCGVLAGHAEERQRDSRYARALHERSASPITNGLPRASAQGEPFEKEIRLGWKELLAGL